MTLNITNVTNITTISGLFQTANDVSYNYFGIGIALVPMLLLFIGIRKNSSDGAAITAASLFQFFLNLLLLNLEMISVFWVTLPLIIFALSLFPKGQ